MGKVPLIYKGKVIATLALSDLANRDKVELDELAVARLAAAHWKSLPKFDMNYGVLMGAGLVEIDWEGPEVCVKTTDFGAEVLLAIGLVDVVYALLECDSEFRPVIYKFITFLLSKEQLAEFLVNPDPKVREMAQRAIDQAEVIIESIREWRIWFAKVLEE